MYMCVCVYYFWNKVVSEPICYLQRGKLNGWGREEKFYLIPCEYTNSVVNKFTF